MSFSSWQQVLLKSLFFHSPLSSAFLSFSKQFEFHLPLPCFVLCEISQLGLRAHSLCKSRGCEYPHFNIPNPNTPASFHPQARPRCLQEPPREETREAPNATESLLFSHYPMSYQGIHNGLTILQFSILSALVSWHYSLHKEIRQPAKMAVIISESACSPAIDLWWAEVETLLSLIRQNRVQQTLCLFYRRYFNTGFWKPSMCWFELLD